MAPTQVQGYMTEMTSCSDEQLGALTRFKAINLDYEADESKIPSEETMASKLTSGHNLTPNPERIAQLQQRIEELTKKNGLGGMGGLPINLG